MIKKLPALLYKRAYNDSLSLYSRVAELLHNIVLFFDKIMKVSSYFLYYTWFK